MAGISSANLNAVVDTVFPLEEKTVLPVKDLTLSFNTSEKHHIARKS